MGMGIQGQDEYIVHLVTREHPEGVFVGSIYCDVVVAGTLLEHYKDLNLTPRDFPQND